MTRQPDDIEFVVRRAGDDPFGDKELRATKGFTSQDIVNAVSDVRFGTYAIAATPGDVAVPKTRAKRGMSIDVIPASVVIRVDAGCTTQAGGSAKTVLDTHCVATDVGRSVTGTNIPAGAVIQSVIAGVSFAMNLNATGAASGLSLTIATLAAGFAASLSGQGTVDPTSNGQKLWGISGSNLLFPVRSFDAGQTYGGTGGLSTAMNSETITAVIPTEVGNILCCTSDGVSTSVPSTYCNIWRSTDGNTGAVFTKVATLPVGGYISAFSFDCRTPGRYLVSTYGYRQDLSTTVPNQNGRYVYLSTDAGLTWTQVLDTGAYSRQHTHMPYVDPMGRCWLTTGDGDNDHQDADAASDPNRRAVWGSPTGAAGTWTPYVLLDPDDPTTQLQAVAICQFTTLDGTDWIYCGEDNSTRGRIYRFKPSNPTGTIEVVYDPAVGTVHFVNHVDQTPNNGIWTSSVFEIAVDPLYKLMWTYHAADADPNRSAWRVSRDGENFIIVDEAGKSIEGPGISRINFGADYVYHGKQRLPRMKAIPTVGHAHRESQTLVYQFPGTLATQADAIVLRPDLLGYDFRVVGVVLHVLTPPGSGSVSLTARRGSGGVSLTRTSGDPTVAAGASGTALLAKAVLDPTTRRTAFRSAYADELHIDLTAATGGTTANVYVVIERLSGTPVPMSY